MVKKKRELSYQESILEVLRDGPLWTSEISRRLNKHSGHINYYLKKMEKEGTIISERELMKGKKAILVKWKIVG